MGETTKKNFGYQNPRENLILHNFRTTLLYISSFPINFTVPFNAPSCFACKLQPSSVSYRCWRHVQGATQTVKHKR